MPAEQVTVGDLSPAQRRVADLVGLGLTNAEIAAKLHVTPNTVKSHLYNLFIKMGVNNRAQLAALMGDNPRYRTTAEVVSTLHAMRDDLITVNYALGTPNWYRQEGKLAVLDALIAQLGVCMEERLHSFTRREARELAASTNNGGRA